MLKQQQRSHQSEKLLNQNKLTLGDADHPYSFDLETITAAIFLAYARGWPNRRWHQRYPTGIPPGVAYRRSCEPHSRQERVASAIY